MTIIWFVVWLPVNTFSGHRPLLFDPVNAWAAALILAIGLDLAAAHAPRPSRRPAASQSVGDRAGCTDGPDRGSAFR